MMRFTSCGPIGALLVMLATGSTEVVRAADANAREDEVVSSTSLKGLDAEAEPKTEVDPAAKPSRKLGLEVASPEERFSVHAWLRAQTRFSDPFDSDPLTPDAFDDPPGDELELRRARIKAEGNLGSPNVEFYFEHELTEDAPLLDLRVDVVLPESFQLRIGQYKVLYNRERVDSSGKQTFAERSISTYAFTLDRQRGLTLAKHWAPDTTANQWLMLGVFEGDSRDPGPRGDEPMYVARWQWHFLGPDLPFSQSDLKFRDTPAASFALAAATVRGPYTRFSSSGGGQLDGFEAGGDERYRLTQWLQEFAWHYRGIAIQQEYHVKQIDDRDLGTDSTLRGGYLQIGKAWHMALLGPHVPVEIAARYAHVDWNDTPHDRTEREYTLAANVFFDGHNSKLTADVSRLELDYAGAASRSDTRWRLQWDFSF
jgi:hypothetical protein